MGSSLVKILDPESLNAISVRKNLKKRKFYYFILKAFIRFRFLKYYKILSSKIKILKLYNSRLVKIKKLNELM